MKRKIGLNIKNEIYALLDSLDCDHGTWDGIVHVTTPDGVKWDFTVPQEAINAQ